MLLSKNKNLFSPSYWPSYYRSAKGCMVTDLDGNQFIDFASNGIGACSLGFANDEIDDFVIETIKNGVMSSLNCPAEVDLAKSLCELHPWANMSKFARSGGEANAISIRIARAASGKDKVAFCGYHGWHDWYLAANISSGDSLSSHLLEGLGSRGVPSTLKDSVVPLRYNNFDDLDILSVTHDIGVVKLEPTRSCSPLPGYLERIRDICDEKGIVLIFDECTSGFREAFGGVHLNYGVNPDICILGKALGNGYAITAILGTEKVMNYALETFISSTFWTEAIGSNAALKTLEVMNLQASWTKLPNLGKQVKDVWQKSAMDNNIQLIVEGLDALPTFKFVSEYSSALKTAFTELMLDRGFLATTQFYPSTAHSESSINSYQVACDDVFAILSSIHDSQVKELLCRGNLCNPSFKRLN